MVDVPVLGTGVLRRVGSSPTKGKLLKFISVKKLKFYCILYMSGKATNLALLALNDNAIKKSVLKVFVFN